MSKARLVSKLASFLNAGGKSAGPNRLMNGGFDIWQRGVSFTGSGYCADRWQSMHGGGTTKTASRQAFTIGQTDVPGAPLYFLRHIVASTTAATAFSLLAQRMEGVRTFAGKRVTVTFWAKADSVKNIAFDLFQHFGSGGSPSALVGGIGKRLLALTTAWQQFSFAVDVPNINGKVLGTDLKDCLGARVWFDAGSNFNADASNLGQQSGTFDIARFSVVEGDATGAPDPFTERHLTEELMLCLRYYQTAGEGLHGHAFSTSGVRMAGQFIVPMRDGPSYALLRDAFTWLQGNSTKSLSTASIAFIRMDKGRGFRFGITNTGETTLTAGAAGQYYEDNAPLIEFESEL